MSEPKIDDLLSRYASRKTTPNEENNLFRAAAEDQDAFEALAQEELLRELMDDPSARQALLKATAPQAGWQASLAKFFQFRTLLSLAGATAAAAVALTVFVHRPGSEPLNDKSLDKTMEGVSGIQKTLTSMESVPDAVKKQFDSYAGVSRPNDGAVRIELNQKSYHVDDGLRITFQCDIEAKLVLIAETSDGQARMMFPNGWTKSPEVPAQMSESVPPTTERPILLDAAPGRLHLMLVAFPADSDLSIPLPSGGALPKPLAVTSTDIDIAAK
jgi:hypothetical protein